ncbi:hypothetical protein BY458DRAFT_516243 [Sporodiniella umbellata]|nr:hypothetical protein BY458DRAFT_516243 [Sporodiniella umbellata]
MHRQRVRQRKNQQVSSVSICKPSVEESLQSWLKRDKTISGLYLPDVCLCCQRSHCENLETTIFAIRKLEEEARLAAEIGQILLYKHEQFVLESNESTAYLEERLRQSEEKVQQLEQLLLQSETAMDDMELQRNKLAWDYEKTQKILDKTLKEADVYHQKSSQLASELEDASKEIEKLRARQLMMDEAGLREDNLRSEIEEITQELATSKRAEHLLESKYKKLQSKYESVCKDDPFMNLTKTFKPKSFMGESIEENNSQWVQMIKELVSANNTLKKDLQKHSSKTELMCDASRYYNGSSESQPVDDGLYHPTGRILQRLQQTDTRALNRKLHRAFDIFDLSSMSNVLIENILKTEVETLFGGPQEEFASLVQSMLREIALLRITINDIQVEYVKKIQESSLGLEKENTQTKEPAALDWVADMFHGGPKQRVIQRRCSLPTTEITKEFLPSSRVIRHNLFPSTYSRSCARRRLALSLPNLNPRDLSIRRKRSLLPIGSTSWLGNKIIK